MRVAPLIDAAGPHTRFLPLPDLEIATAAEGSPLYRVRGALSLTDGRIVIANGGRTEIAFYDSIGRFLHTVGAYGHGPLEFVNITSVSLLSGDSIAIYDGGRSLLTTLGPDGELVETTPVPAVVGGFTTAVLPLGSGSFVLHATTFTSRMRTGWGYARDTTVLALFDRRSKSATVVGSFPNTETLILRGRFGNGARRILQAPLSRFLHTAVGGAKLFVGVSDEDVVQVYGSDGTLRQVVTRATQPTRISRRSIQRTMNRGSEFRFIRGLLDRSIRLRYPSTLPAFSSLAVSKDGRVWIERYSPPWIATDNVWDVYAPERNWMWEDAVAVPTNCAVLHVSRAYLLALCVDAEGRESVRRYSLATRR